MRCNRVWNWATWMPVEIKLQVLPHGRRPRQHAPSSLASSAFQTLRFEREKGKNVVTLHFCSPLVLAFIHFIIIFIRPRDCDAVFACRRRSAPGFRSRGCFIRSRSTSVMRGHRTSYDKLGYFLGCCGSGSDARTSLTY